MPTKTKTEGRTGRKPAASASSRSSCPEHSSVEQRAWEIWQEKGCPQGRDMENWIEAEKELGRKK